MMDQDRQQILNTFLRILEHISDLYYQRRVWILGEGPEVDDFDETACHFFQEGDGIIDEYTEYEINDHQYQLLKKFRETFQIFSDEHDWPEDFIDTPEWAKIMQMAKEVLEAFGYNRGEYKHS